MYMSGVTSSAGWYKHMDTNNKNDLSFRELLDGVAASCYGSEDERLECTMQPLSLLSLVLSLFFLTLLFLIVRHISPYHALRHAHGTCPHVDLFAWFDLDEDGCLSKSEMFAMLNELEQLRNLPKGPQESHTTANQDAAPSLAASRSESATSLNMLADVDVTKPASLSDETLQDIETNYCEVQADMLFMARASFVRWAQASKCDCCLSIEERPSFVLFV